ncbi:hypothetical protein Leryth_000975, partial [Lithospermum erythrorhizon]
KLSISMHIAMQFMTCPRSLCTRYDTEHAKSLRHVFKTVTMFINLSWISFKQYKGITEICQDSPIPRASQKFRPNS